MAYYDANGNRVAAEECYLGDTSVLMDYGNGNVYWQGCSTALNNDGTCDELSSGGDLYTYENGKLVSKQWCYSIESDGSCSDLSDNKTTYNYEGDKLVSSTEPYSGGYYYKYIYDGDTIVGREECFGDNCNPVYYTIYDGDGKLLMGNSEGSTAGE